MKSRGPDDPFTEGYGCLGPLSKNPYPPCSKEWAMWRGGWYKRFHGE